MRFNADDQFETLRIVLGSGWIKSWMSAIDGGAHVGRWTAEMAKWFSDVHAFEASPQTAELLVEAVGSRPNVVVHKKALFSSECRVDVVEHPKKMKPISRYVIPTTAGEVMATTIDSLGLQHCGLIKLDIEGAEHDAILGGINTIRRCSPVIIVELDGHGEGNGFGHSVESTTSVLHSLGYRLMLDRKPDLVFVP